MPTIAIWYRAGDTDNFAHELRSQLAQRWLGAEVILIAGNGTDFGGNIAAAYRESWSALLIVAGDRGLGTLNLVFPFKGQDFRGGLEGHIPIVLVIRNAELGIRLRSAGSLGPFLTRGIDVPTDLMLYHPWIIADSTNAAGLEWLAEQIRREVVRRQWPPAFLDDDVLGRLRATAPVGANVDAPAFREVVRRDEVVRETGRYADSDATPSYSGNEAVLVEARYDVAVNFIRQLKPWEWLLIAGTVYAIWELGHEATTAIGSLLKSLSATVAPPSVKPSRGSRPLDISAFAPEEVARGDEALVQIYLHHAEQKAKAAARAREGDTKAGRRDVTTLEVDVAAGDCVDIMLVANGASVDQPHQHLVWQGEPRGCRFVLKLSKDFERDGLIVQATVIVNKRPVGALSFRLSVTYAASIDKWASDIRGDVARPYRHAFLSYSSRDRARVLEHAQLLERLRFKYFLDLLKLTPGERWKRRLYEEIDRCDVFVLFWSSHAKASKWVTIETERARARRGGDEDAPPDIIPFVLEKPPPAPPAGWQDIHFDDWLRYVIDAVEANAKRTAQDNPRD